ncbi:MAG: DUF4124 domain-containing protein [Deltaproteobacteria bacterium]|nr:DUF4124 domain-containing protein [Deltaproteobacteria bacterium]
MNPARALVRRRLLLPILPIMTFGAVAVGQTYYKWTDADGIVHFSDQQPAAGKNKVEQRDLIPPPPPPEPLGGGAQVPEGSEAGSPSGPPRVVILEQDSPRTSPTSVRIFGKVKNVGGEVAGGVAISVSAIDVGQGNPCLQTEAEVSPSSLKPGDTGTFDSNIESPCLLGNSPVSLLPSWQP